MLHDFSVRLKDWREQCGFSHAEAASYINSQQTGERITAETLAKLEAGASPALFDQNTLEFFMNFNVVPTLQCKANAEAQILPALSAEPMALRSMADLLLHCH